MSLFIVMMMLGGCTNSVEFTDEEVDMFAEYISKEVLERDKHYDQELIELATDPEEEVEADEDDDQQHTTNSNQSTDNKDNTSNQNEKEFVSINDILGTSSVEVSYHSSKKYESYPEGGNNYFVITSNQGYQLLVVTFNLKNTTDKEVSYSMLESEIDYNLILEDGSDYKPLLTLLVDDMQFVNKMIPANKKQQGVLVFRIPDSKVSQSGVLKVVDGTKKASLTIH